jgi:hypothetical protein
MRSDSAISCLSSDAVDVLDDVHAVLQLHQPEIGPNGGNVTVYVTSGGVILVDAKNERMHDDLVAKVRSINGDTLVVDTMNSRTTTGCMRKAACRCRRCTSRRSIRSWN